MSHRHATHTHRPNLPDLLDLLDLDAEVLAGPLHDVRVDLERLADVPVRRVLDVGAGTGAGSFGLLRHFGQAQVTALDADEEMLAHLRARAGDLGLADRVTAVYADLDQPLGDLGPVDLGSFDLVWASASLHHLTDPDRTLTGLVGALRPGGLLAVLELTGLPRFVPDGTPGAEAEARAHALHAADRAIDLPAMGSAWGDRLRRAGLVVELERDVMVHLTGASDPAVAQYAAATLTRVRGAVADRFDAVDLAALDALLDGGPGDVRRREDLVVRTTRSLWVARRPTQRTAVAAKKV